MGLNSSVILSIINLVFYIPVLPLALFVVFRHGLKKSAGWVYLLILSVIRLVGEPMIIASNGDPTTSIGRTGLILSSVGLTALLNAPLGVLTEVNSAVGVLSGGNAPIPGRLLVLAHLPSTVAIALYASGATSTDPADAASAQTHKNAGAAIFIVCWLLLTLLAVVMFGLVRSRLPKHSSGGATAARTMVHGVLALLPFLLLRVVYTCITAFGSASEITNVPLRAVLGSAMEWIVVLILLVAGLRAAPLARSVVTVADDYANDGGNNPTYASPSYNQQQYQQQYQYEQSPAYPAPAAAGPRYDQQQRGFYSAEAVQQRQDQRGWKTQHRGMEDLYELGSKLGERLENRLERKMDRGHGRHGRRSRSRSRR